MVEASVGKQCRPIGMAPHKKKKKNVVQIELAEGPDMKKSCRTTRYSTCFGTTRVTPILWRGNAFFLARKK